jgi:hypothetical protein
MARVVIDKALAGDVVTARFCLDRLEPKPRSRPIEIDLPDGARARDLVAAFDATVRAMASGEITPDEALQVTRVLDGRRKAIEAAWREDERDNAAAKPPPSGPFDKRSGGLGEGIGRGLSGDRKGASRRPHPGPPERLSKGPWGEGIMRAGERANLAEAGSDASVGAAPHPSIAKAMGASLSNTFDKRSGGRAAGRANLLHSTCISSRSLPLAWMSRAVSVNADRPHMSRADERS